MQTKVPIAAETDLEFIIAFSRGRLWSENQEWDERPGAAKFDLVGVVVEACLAC